MLVSIAIPVENGRAPLVGGGGAHTECTSTLKTGPHSNGVGVHLGRTQAGRLISMLITMDESDTGSLGRAVPVPSRCPACLQALAGLGPGPSRSPLAS